MGDYANDAFERELDGACYDYDHGEFDAFSVGYPIIHTNNKNDFPVEKNFNYIKLDCSILKFGDEWLLRKGTEFTDKLNKTVYIASVTDKAVLFTFSEEWENVYHWQMKGLQFWLPKSILYKHKQHKKVIYIPKWAKIKIINPPEN